MLWKSRPVDNFDSMTMSETNGTSSVAEKSAGAAAAEGKQAELSMAKKPRFDDSIEDRDFDEETQKALEEIDANQNEIDALNERKYLSTIFGL